MTINRNIVFVHLLLKLWNGFVVQHIGNLILIWNMFRKYINISYNKMTYDFHRYIALYNPYCCIYIYLGYVAVNFSAFIVNQIFCFITQDKWPIFSTGKINLFTSIFSLVKLYCYNGFSYNIHSTSNYIFRCICDI